MVGSRQGAGHIYCRPTERDAMSATAANLTAARRRNRTGGPDDGPKLLEHVMGWTLVVVVAMLITQLHLL